MGVAQLQCSIPSEHLTYTYSWHKLNDLTCKVHVAHQYTVSYM